jgi:D-glycero-D-manno-heptose 1,7-bisphosphate phosphatase
MNSTLRPALFLDRDGVINVDHGYVHKPEQVSFIPGIFELVAQARATGHAVVVVTNQAGIGRGYYTEDDFHAFTAWMLEQFAARGAPIDRVYFCPDHPEHGVGPYKRDTPMRKPGPGMLLQAAAELQLDLPRSLLLGDTESDVMAGIHAGVGRTLRFHADDGPAPETRAHAVVRSLHAVLPYLN